MSNDVKQILDATLYCNVATVCDDSTPWNTPVFFGYDDDLNLYWRSWTENIHSKNLALSPAAFITIYDSQLPFDTGSGLFLSGHVVQLKDKPDIETALQIMDRRSPRRFNVQEFMDDNPRRVYKFTPAKLWRNVDSEVNDKFVDRREELALPSRTRL